MSVINYSNLLCVVNLKGNHPLFSSFIWIVSRVVPSNVEYAISLFNIIITLCSLILFYKLIKLHVSDSIAFISTLSLLLSSNFLVYSISLKQYPIEFLGSVFFLGFFYEVTKKDSLALSSYSKLLFSVLLCLSSLTLLVFFGIILLLIIFYKKIIPNNYLTLVIVFLPVSYFAPHIYRRINNPFYTEYWSSFFIQTSNLTEFIGSADFIFDLIMRNYFGIFYISGVSIIYFLFFLVPLFFKDNVSIPVYIILTVFLILNLLKFYPLGGGRTDLILFPFFVFIYSRAVSLLKFKQLIISTVSFLLFFAIPFVNDPYYKIENISPILEDVSQIVNNNNALIVPMDEQQQSFEFYSSKLYGQHISTLENGCKILLPSISNYLVYKPSSEFRMELINQSLTLQKPSSIFNRNRTRWHNW